jgi:hypothetical protein
MALQPLDPVPLDPLIAELAKTDLHVHQEASARLEQMAALGRVGRRTTGVIGRGTPSMRSQRASAGWRSLGTRRLARLRGGAPRRPRAFVAMVDAILEDGPVDGAVLVQVRFGPSGGGAAGPDLMALFRADERQVQARYPRLRAGAIGYLNVRDDPEWLRNAESQPEACLQAARHFPQR